SLGIMSRKIPALRAVSSRRVSPGRCLAPAVITMTSAPSQTEMSELPTIVAGPTNSSPWLRSRASARTFFESRSYREMWSAMPRFKAAKATAVPTAPAPTIDRCRTASVCQHVVTSVVRSAARTPTRRLGVDDRPDDHAEGGAGQRAPPEGRDQHPEEQPPPGILERGAPPFSYRGRTVPPPSLPGSGSVSSRAALRPSVERPSRFLEGRFSVPGDGGFGRGAGEDEMGELVCGASDPL